MVRLKVATEGLEGLVKGAVRLGTDDPDQPNYILRYDVDVRPEVSVDGLRKSFGDVARHEHPEARYRFTREGGEPLKLVLASAVPALTTWPSTTARVAPYGTLWRSRSRWLSSTIRTHSD